MSDAAAEQVIDKAFDLGITFFDTADIYGRTASGGKAGDGEAVLGKFLGARRKDIVLASKFGQVPDAAGRRSGNSRRAIIEAVEASLRRLRTDWLDLYYIHWPDPLTPLEETLRAMDDLIRQGKVRYPAHSNFPAWQAAEASWLARQHNLNPCVACQCEYSLLGRDAERELIPALTAHGVGLVPYWPLASGLLSGRYRRGEPPAEGSRFTKMRSWADRFLTEANFQVVERLEAFCAERGHALIELAFNWLLAQPAVSSVIAGVSSAEQLESNVAAVGWRLDVAELAEIDRITRGA